MSSVFLRILPKTCANLVILAVGCRGETEMTFEGLGQMALVGEAAFERDVSKRQIRLFQQMLCALDTLTHNKLVRAFSSSLAEQTSEVIGAEADLLSQHGKREVLVEMGENEVSHPADCHSDGYIIPLS